MTRSSLPWVSRIQDLIEDGPVEVNWLIAEVAGLVPPGRAWRAREWLRKYAAQQKGLEIRESDVTDEAIRSGQRTVVREAIGKLVYAKKARYLEHEGVKYLEKHTPPRLTSEERSRRNRERWESLSSEERDEWKTKNLAGRMALTPEERSNITRRGWITRRSSESR